jgi:predicted solute-binding protein
MDPLRIACVRYLNTVPLIEGLDKAAGVTLIPCVPSTVAGLVAAGDADVGLASLIDAAASEVPLALVPAGMIGCDGPTLTVRLFSSVPLGQVTAVHADTDSHTSVVLCQVLLSRLFGVRPRMIAFDARERIPVRAPGPTGALEDSWPQTLLLIGDKVVTDSPPAVRYSHQLDLGEAWKKLTGLPFVYAMWMCRESEADSPKIALAAALLDRQRRHNATRLDWIVSTRAAEHRWPIDLARTYLTGYLRFQVGPRERQAAALFLEEAAALNLAPRAHPRWIELLSPTNPLPAHAASTT